MLKPTGLIGHGIGIVGSVLMVIGVFGYMARKRFRSLSRLGVLKYWLEFHIFLCSLGPTLVLFHTAFKFGGIVSIAFWSMIAVVASGVIGRYIYIQIPRTIEGRALSLQEVQNMKTDISNVLEEKYKLNPQTIQLFLNFTPTDKSTTVSTLDKALKSNNLTKPDRISILKMVKNERKLSRRISRLEVMKKWFKYWHVAHMPFALIMLAIVIVHVVVAFTFGYKWIF